MRLFTGLMAGLALASCATTKPCAIGGDLSWPTQFKGDRTCQQRKLPDGSFINHGKFIQYYEDGKIALEGDFQDGRKNGVWIQYDDKGQKSVEKYYENGVERYSKDLPK